MDACVYELARFQICRSSTTGYLECDHRYYSTIVITITIHYNQTCQTAQVSNELPLSDYLSVSVYIE